MATIASTIKKKPSGCWHYFTVSALLNLQSTTTGLK